MDGHPHDATNLLCVCHLKDKSSRDVVRRVKVYSNGLDPCFIGCTPIIDWAFVHGASLTLHKNAVDGAVGTSCLFCEF